MSGSRQPPQECGGQGQRSSCDDRRGDQLKASPERQVELARERLEALRRNAAQKPDYDPNLFEEALEELAATLEELHVITEELREQNEELIETRGALESEHHRYQELFDFAPNGYLVTDRLGTIRDANHAAAAMLNLRRDFLSGKPIVSYVVPRHHGVLHTQLARLEEETGSAIEWEMGFRPRNAATFDATVRVGGIRDHRGELLGLRWAIIDVSAHKRLEEELHNLYEAEKEVSARLKTLDEMKDAFLQAVSHELRSPVTSVIGFASLLSAKDRDIPAETREEILRQLSASAKKLDRLLADLLDLDRISTGIVETRPRPTDVAELARQVVAESGFRFTNDIEVEGDAIVADIDVPMVERIVDNLVGNAVRHTGPGTRIWIKVITEDEGVMLEVDDEGPGVPDAYKEDIFLPFARGKAHELVPGTGVGLALVAKFAQLHSGRAWVEDRPGGGASFRVWLPSPGVTKGAAG